MPRELLKTISAERPVLIAGPTASGKSALALEIAAHQGGAVVNTDALQVFANWRVLTARPTAAEEAVAPHLLYGHVAGNAHYSVGHWLREAVKALSGRARPIFVGGTGLYFAALTEGLADIPPTPERVRTEAERRIEADGAASLLAELDAATAARIDVRNPVRVQRAWEVLRTTGRGLADWQEETPEPALPLAAAEALLIDADRDWLLERIDRRFDHMLAHGALDEARRNLAGWDPAMPSSKAIGAAQLIAHLKGDLALGEAADAGKTATRQYAKRQRTWFRARMQDWRTVAME